MERMTDLEIQLMTRVQQLNGELNSSRHTEEEILKKTVSFFKTVLHSERNGEHVRVVSDDEIDIARLIDLYLKFMKQ